MKTVKKMRPVKTIYLVEGSTGEYEDSQDWVVCAYLEKSLAEEHVRLAQERANELEKARGSKYESLKGTNKYDLDMAMDYTGTSYGVVESTLEDQLPT